MGSMAEWTWQKKVRGLDKLIDIIQSEQKREKIIEKNDQSLRNL